MCEVKRSVALFAIIDCRICILTVCNMMTVSGIAILTISI